MTIFVDILGQPKATKLLDRALENDRLAHAYLFTGPEGVGKKKTALHFAAALLCLEKNKPEPCGTCSTCIQFSGGNNPDFLHIKPQGATIKIDQVRDLKKALGYPPLESPCRVIVLEEVHAMRREAANSLLKLLEEPPPDNILLLTAIDSEPLLSTIVSRCQVIPFYPIPVELTSKIILQDHSQLSEEQARNLAHISGGSPGLAKAFETEQLLPTYDKIVQCLLQKGQTQAEKIESALILAMQSAELKEGLEQLFDLLRIFFKESMVAGLQGQERETHHISKESDIFLARELWNLEQLSDMVQVVDFMTKALARNCNRQMVCEVLFLQLLNS